MKNSKNIQLNRQQGLTLIELMVATIILAILTAAAVPAMKSLFDRQSTKAIGDYFVKSVKLARVEAIQRGRTVTLVTKSGSDDWSEGWDIQFVNADGNIEVIRSFPAPSGAPVFNSDVYDGATPLSFLPTGQVTTVGNFDLYYDDCVGDQRLSFTVLLSGLMKRGVSSCSTITP